ncbi:hypothetical protein SCHPADRAFT_940259 [Schizopora paradoxa]|uniref:DUF6533 domain-containing protein n=1 Tax=Schizopora paradoxa TaxID=27342 RepID=A0A0H2RPR1_9AGAM|nr:hypothetical protein SCHPADRAFT_940259 [Schizopora paradoxa]
MASQATSTSSLIEDVQSTRLTNYVAFLGFSILVWDHIITFDDEIKYIWARDPEGKSLWSRKRNLLVYLFLLNRYFVPLSFIGNLFGPATYRIAAQFPRLTSSPQPFSHFGRPNCQHFVRYEGSCTVIAIEVSALIMFQRIRALYRYQRKVQYFVAGILLVETVIFALLMTSGTAVIHPDLFDHGMAEFPEYVFYSHSFGFALACTMIFNSKRWGGAFFPSLRAFIPLFYDTVIIVLTLIKYREFESVRTNGSGKNSITRTLLRGGMLYYSVIFVISTILAIMVIKAPSNLKNIAGQLQELLTVAMVSRITLALKSHDWEKTAANTDAVRMDSMMFPGHRSPHHQPKVGDAFSIPPSLLSTSTLPYSAMGSPVVSVHSPEAIGDGVQVPMTSSRSPVSSKNLTQFTTVNEYSSFSIVKARSDFENDSDKDDAKTACIPDIPRILPTIDDESDEESQR